MNAQDLYKHQRPMEQELLEVFKRTGEDLHVQWNKALFASRTYRVLRWGFVAGIISMLAGFVLLACAFMLVFSLSVVMLYVFHSKWKTAQSRFYPLDMRTS